MKKRLQLWLLVETNLKWSDSAINYQWEFPTVLFACPATAPRWGAGRHPGSGARGVGRVWIPGAGSESQGQDEFCVLGCSRAACSGQESGRWEQLKKWGWGVFSWIRRAWGCTEPLIHRNTLFLKTKFTGTAINNNCAAKDAASCSWYKVASSHAFVIFLFCSPSANQWPLPVSVYVQDKSVGSLCFGRSSKPTPPSVTTLLP